MIKYAVNSKKHIETAEKIVSQMTVEEMMSQLLFESPAIERLGINEYNWWNEACHGVARAGMATVFPQSIGLAACFNPELVEKIAAAVATEGRAKYNQSIKQGDRGIYRGLTYWAPNVNIFRDPRWGRGQETCGEDPFLTASIGTAYIRGLQGDGEFLKAAACAKHFAAHSGPESKRHSFNAIVSEKDLAETYLPAFEQCVKSGVSGVMGAYNRTNDEPCCASNMLTDILRNRWGFEGYFVSDCGAIMDIMEGHKLVQSREEAAALALNAGTELNCGGAYEALNEAFDQDLIDEETIKNACVRLFTIRAALGEFEENRPFSDIKYCEICSEENKALAEEAAKQSLVMLENKGGFLPIENFQGSIAVIGPNAANVLALEGNYNGRADKYVTVAEGMRRLFSNCKISEHDGSPLSNRSDIRFQETDALLNDAVIAANNADLVVLCLGLDRTVEGEDLGFENDFTDHGDRKTMKLPKEQMKLASAVTAANKNTIVVTMCGSCVDLGDEIRAKIKAHVHAWYPGQLGGLAIAKLLAGEFSPSGRLPISFYRDDAILPDMEDYSMKNRTYRFGAEGVLYPFGYGLSYSDFSIGTCREISHNENEIRLVVSVTNTGNIASRRITLCYASFFDSRTKTPHRQLCAMSSNFFTAGESKKIELKIDRYWLKAVLPDGSRVDPNWEIKFAVE